MLISNFTSVWVGLGLAAPLFLHSQTGLPKKGSVLLVYMIRRSSGVLGDMRRNESIRMQQSKASGTVQ